MNVLNLLNETNPTVINSSVSGIRLPRYTVQNTYNMPLNYSTPRYVMFSASYDW